jgi:hypothetical protein
MWLAIPNLVLFSLNHHPVTLWEILTLLVIGWAIDILPRPLAAIASILLVLWVISTLGIIVVAGLSKIIIIAIIIAIIL